MGKGELTRQRIVDAADELFYHKGYHQSAVSDIEALTGLSKGNITYYFRNKDQLLDAVLDQRKAGIRKLLQGWDQAFTTPLERLNRFAEMLLIEQNSLVEFGCPMGSLLTELGKTDKAMAGNASAMFDLFIEWLTSQFLDAGYAKKKARMLALRFLSQAQGASLLAHAYADNKILQQSVQDIREWSQSLCSEPPS
jgi:AcrR family transcriptional regulator